MKAERKEKSRPPMDLPFALSFFPPSKVIDLRDSELIRMIARDSPDAR
jgi:hypothetical protein